MVQCSLHAEVERLRDAASARALDKLLAGVRSLADYAHQLGGHCNVTLVNDALRDFHAALEDPSTTFSSLKDLNAVSVCVCVCVCLCVCVCVCGVHVVCIPYSAGCAMSQSGRSCTGSAGAGGGNHCRPAAYRLHSV